MGLAIWGDYRFYEEYGVVASRTSNMFDSVFTDSSIILLGSGVVAGLVLLIYKLMKARNRKEWISDYLKFIWVRLGFSKKDK